MTRSGKRLIACLAAALLLPASSVFAKGLVSGTYTLNYSQDVQKKLETTDNRTFKQSLETKYSGFLSPIITNEIGLKIDYEKVSDSEPKIRFYPTATLAYKGAYWAAGSKRSITREPDTNQKVTDSNFVDLMYQPLRTGMPDFKGKYTADFDYQSGATDKFKQGVQLSSAYQPVDWFTLKGEYNWTSDTERFVKDPTDRKFTPVTQDEKYSFTAGIRHFFSDKLKYGAEWKSEFSRGAAYFDNGAASADTVKEDQSHIFKQSLAFRPFADTVVDATFDYDLKQTMIPKIVAGQAPTQEHTITTKGSAKITQKIGKPISLSADFSRNKSDVRHTLTPTVTIDDGWNFDAKGDFAKQLQLGARYTEHRILTLSPGDPANIPGRTATKSRGATWTGELMPFWKPAATYDRVDTYDFLLVRGGTYLKTSETKYGLKSPFDIKFLKLTLEPSYDISIKNDYTSNTPDLQEATSTRDFKFKIVKTLLTTPTLEIKVDHTYGRKTEQGHLNTTLNNVARTDGSTFALAWKDGIPGFAGGIDFTRSATDTSGDADLPDVIENFGFKADYKYERITWNASYKYDRNLRFDKSNKWTFDSKMAWSAPRWDASISYTQYKTLAALVDEGYKFSLDLKYNF
jgi:hypothetical protein